MREVAFALACCAALACSQPLRAAEVQLVAQEQFHREFSRVRQILNLGDACPLTQGEQLEFVQGGLATSEGARFVQLQAPLAEPSLSASAAELRAAISEALRPTMTRVLDILLLQTEGRFEPADLSPAL